MNRDVYMQSY